jgi:hypothetical protein
MMLYWASLGTSYVRRDETLQMIWVARPNLVRTTSFSILEEAEFTKGLSCFLCAMGFNRFGS